MKIRFGYACLPISISETSSSTMTYTHYKKLGNRAYDKLNSIILSNFDSLKKILKYNIANDISFFRLTSNLIPLISHPNVSINLNNYKDNFKEIGNIINNNHMRIDIHLDPYYVLNSIRDEVVSSTINILKIYQNMFKLMNINYKIITHVGGKTGGKKAGIERFINNFNKLDKEIQKHIIVENDDKIYNIRNTLKICKTLNIPMVLDYHHFLCNRNNEKIEDYIEKIFLTWHGETPKIHFSSPKNKKEFRSHHEYIDTNSFIKFLDKIKNKAGDFDCMIEAKAKDEALFRLIRNLKYLDYKIDKNTLYLEKN